MLPHFFLQPVLKCDMCTRGTKLSSSILGVSQGNFVHFSTARPIFCFKFACGDDVVREKNLCGDSEGKDLRGRDGEKVCGEGVRMGTVLWERGGNGDKQPSRAAFIAESFEHNNGDR